MGVLLGVAERALDGNGRWAFWENAVLFGVATCGCETDWACGGGTACCAGVEGFRGGSACLTLDAGFVSGCRKQSGQSGLQTKRTFVCFSSISEKGLRGDTLLRVILFASLTGLSGGGVTRCGMALKLLFTISVCFQHVQHINVLFGQLVGQHEVAELA